METTITINTTAPRAAFRLGSVSSSNSVISLESEMRRGVVASEIMVRITKPGALLLFHADGR